MNEGINNMLLDGGPIGPSLEMSRVARVATHELGSAKNVIRW